MSAIVPIPKFPIHIRTATVADIPFMDSLQKKYGKALGYFPRKQFEGYVEGGNVLIAEKETRPIGYLISKDRYLKRDELGVIFQLCVAPDVQRGFVGATLVKAAFERSAYGCRLYCLWCAQDLDANRFWESLGFVPIAFRAGSDKKKRVHIFWQKRIVEGDQETKWWYPCKTEGGAMGADRIVFPIPPGVHWSEVVAPEIPVTRTSRPCLEAPRTGGTPVSRKTKTNASGPKPGQVAILVGGRLKYVDRPGYVPPAAAPSVPLSLPAPEKPAKPNRGRAAKNPVDPSYLAKARELRDRWSEHVNSGAALIEATGKYDVARALPPQADGPQKLLAAA